MENKYYTPKIEDIRMGYECEFVRQGFADCWYSVVIDDDNILNCIGPLNAQGTTVFREWDIRTPYLTKEQIEVEGWAFTGESNSAYNNLLFRKSTWFLWLNEKEIWLQKGNQMKYDGPCPSINEFRTICKLLNI